ncbi:sensor histidine kinase [Nocardioides sp. SR21]|uniref:sensor histidine kinase n=1 Tax=Nocardioides sp. SR21 TaxID=2919501 RepID=UPI001FA9AA05|nr:histidine kinase [Nocardioides sp. SR21]
MTDWRRWVPDAIAAGFVLVIGLLEVQRNWYVELDPASATIIVALAGAVGLCRALPSAALALAWVIAAVQVASDTYVLTVELALAVVAFGCARWGSTLVVWSSGISIPLGAIIVVRWLDSDLVLRLVDRAGLKTLADAAYRGGDWRLTIGVMLLAILMAPWLLGLALRFSTRADQSRASQQAAEAERDQAEQIARLREEQAQLARDVHDVVGHSLAVILAQAESAQYLDEVDTQGLKRTMANIATAARSSLDDVRQVLSSTSGAAVAPARHADLDSLIEGVRASGHEVVATEVGTPHPLPPDLEVVAFRVLQEMLTNAIKHGRRDQPVRVERHWEGDLRIEVENTVDALSPRAAEETQPIQAVPGGQGLDGMRGRLEAVGGRLDVRRRIEPPTFTATAWVPLRSKP